MIVVRRKVHCQPGQADDAAATLARVAAPSRELVA